MIVNSFLNTNYLPVHEVVHFTIDHFKSKSWLLFFSVQTYFESFMLLEMWVEPDDVALCISGCLLFW